MSAPRTVASAIRDLDPVIHAAKRLAAMALLAHAESADFVPVQQLVGEGLAVMT